MLQPALHVDPAHRRRRHSFVGTPAPRTTQVSQLRFANAADGFAYDTQLWVTHDAGASWHQVRLGGTVTELATAGGFAYAIVRYGHKGAGRLERAPLGSDTWTTLTGAGSAYAGLWAHGPDVLVGSGGGAALAVSHNAGVNFIQASSPSKGLPCNFQEPTAGVVWAHCATGTESATWRSTDSGAHFPGQGHPSVPTPRCSPPPRALPRCSAPTSSTAPPTQGRTQPGLGRAGGHRVAVPGLHRRHPRRRHRLRRLKPHARTTSACTSPATAAPPITSCRPAERGPRLPAARARRSSS